MGITVEKIKVVAFDCDGVMFDTSNANRMYYNRILTHLGRPPLTDAQFKYAHMHTVAAALDYLLPDASLRAEAEGYRKETTYLPLIKYMVMEPYLVAFLNRLRPGRQTAIATNRTDTMDRVLHDHRLTDCFDLVVSAQDVPRPKPAPDPLLRIIDHFGIAPEQAVYIGDSELDEHSARAAGVPLIAFGNPSLAADFHASSLKEVADLFGLNLP